jgi:uncharacterized membrane protein
MAFHETKARSVVKTILWRVIATLITWAVLYMFTGQIRESIEITVVAAIAGIIAYYIYERVWNKINWGKIGD